MEKKTLLLFYLLQFTSFVFSQNVKPELLIEQNALKFFMDNIEGTPIYYSGFQKFSFDSAKIYVHPETYTELKLTIRNRNYSDKQDFFPIDSNNQMEQIIEPDTIKYNLNLTAMSAIDASTVNMEEVRERFDLILGITSRYYYNNHYFVRIFINVQTEWKSNQAIVKLDSMGYPLDIRYEYGDI